MIVNKEILNLKKRRNKRKNNFSILLTILILIMIIIGLNTNNLIVKTTYKKEYSEYVKKYAEEYGVEEELIYAIIKAESNFNANAVSNKEAKGLMQLMDSTAEELAKKSGINLKDNDILEPDVNINLGTKYISNLLDKYNNCTEIALAAYNAGSGNVDKWIKTGVIKSDGSDIENIPYKETNTYIRKIMRDYKIYKDNINA